MMLKTKQQQKKMNMKVNRNITKWISTTNYIYVYVRVRCMILV